MSDIHQRQPFSPQRCLLWEILEKKCSVIFGLHYTRYESTAVSMGMSESSEHAWPGVKILTSPISKVANQMQIKAAHNMIALNGMIMHQVPFSICGGASFKSMRERTHHKCNLISHWDMAQQGYVITCPVKCEMNSLIHSQISTAALLKFGHE